MAEITFNDREGQELGTFQGSCVQTILRSAEEQRVRAPANCYQGICRVCVCNVLEGAEYINPNGAGETTRSQKLEADEIMTCLASLKPNIPEDVSIVLKAQNP